MKNTKTLSGVLFGLSMLFSTPVWTTDCSGIPLFISILLHPSIYEGSPKFVYDDYGGVGHRVVMTRNEWRVCRAVEAANTMFREYFMRDREDKNDVFEHWKPLRVVNPRGALEHFWALRSFVNPRYSPPPPPTFMCGGNWRDFGKRHHYSDFSVVVMEGSEEELVRNKFDIREVRSFVSKEKAEEADRKIRTDNYLGMAWTFWRRLGLFYMFDQPYKIIFMKSDRLEKDPTAEDYIWARPLNGFAYPMPKLGDWGDSFSA